MFSPSVRDVRGRLYWANLTYNIVLIPLHFTAIFYLYYFLSTYKYCESPYTFALVRSKFKGAAFISFLIAILYIPKGLIIAFYFLFQFFPLGLFIC